MSTQAFSETDVRRDPLGRFALQVAAGLAGELTEHSPTEFAPAVRRAIADVGEDVWSEEEEAALDAATDADLDAALRASLVQTAPGRPRHRLLTDHLHSLRNLPGHDEQASAEHFVAFHAAVDYLRSQDQADDRCRSCAAPGFDPHSNGCVQDALPSLAAGESLTITTDDVDSDLHGYDSLTLTGRLDGGLTVRGAAVVSTSEWADVLAEETGSLVSDARARQVLEGQLDCKVVGEVAVTDLSPTVPGADLSETAEEVAEDLVAVRNFEPAVVTKMVDRLERIREDDAQAAYEDRLERDRDGYRR